MTSHDADLQAAVDATSVVHDTGEQEDLVEALREALAERDVETSDEEWLRRTVEGIKADRNYVIDSEPSDFVPRRDREGS
ncbi:hypothetical protein [Nocardioides perillae]|uniref:RNA binding exosome subunit n=1 Tax=Nocardioides perillae TaxID=1119534 RepID=A0A7Y9RPW8_9ACTN|nr:hypothetical protein [Nocardioides perillae]NYG54115.1 RNA binding exosome subunit [Nocardioides perillae]